MKKIYVSHSGGKDSMLAIHRLSKDSDYEIVGLLTTVTEVFDRSTTHGIREELIEEQAGQLGIPLFKVYLPQTPSNESYEARMASAYRKIYDQGIRHIAFGDILLEDVKKYRENQAMENGLESIFPLWGESTSSLIREFVSLGYEAIISTIDPKKGLSDFLGKIITDDLIDQLPPDVDPSGEQGEFHTFVVNGPLFNRPVAYHISKQLHEGPFYTYIDIIKGDTDDGRERE